MKKRLIATILTMVMVLAMLPVMAIPALAANHNVSIDGMTTCAQLEATLQGAINSARSGDTVTVTGTATTDYTVVISIPSGVRVIWKAIFKSDYVPPYHPDLIYAGLLQVGGPGVFEVADGAELVMDTTSPNHGNITLNVYEKSANIEITGGRIEAYSRNGNACHTIGSSKANVNLSISGNAVLLARSYDTGTSNVIDIEDSVGTLHISGNAYIESISENNRDNAAAIGYTKGNAMGNITIDGGTIRVVSGTMNATGIYTQSGRVLINGGSISVSSGGADSHTDIIRVGDNDYHNPTGGVGSGSVYITGGEFTVTNSGPKGNAYGVGIYDHEDNVTITGGTMSVTASGTGGGAYGIYYHHQSDVSIRGHAAITGGSVTVTAHTHAVGIRVADGTAAVTGGNLRTSSGITNEAVRIMKRGTAALLEGAYNGKPYLVDGSTAVIAEVAKGTTPSQGTSDGLSVIVSNGVSSAGAAWDISDVPYVRATGSGSSGLPKTMWATPPIPVPPVIDPIIAFVTRLYQNVLSREPDPYGLDAWVIRLRTREWGGGQVAENFFFGAPYYEFLNRGLNNEEFLYIMYTTFMDREPEAYGWGEWLKRMDNGMTWKEVFDGFVVSIEWGDRCDAAGIRR